MWIIRRVAEIHLLWKLINETEIPEITLLIARTGIEIKSEPIDNK